MYVGGGLNRRGGGRGGGVSTYTVTRYSTALVVTCITLHLPISDVLRTLEDYVEYSMYNVHRAGAV